MITHILKVFVFRSVVQTTCGIWIKEMIQSRSSFTEEIFGAATPENWSYS